MFGTWKYDPETDEVQNLRKAYDPISARSSSHQACNRCHGKKLKCSGEKEGCERCVSHGWTCEYDRPSARVSRKSSRASSKRGEHKSRRGSTPTSTTSPGSPDLPSSSGLGGSSSQPSSARQASSSSPSTSRKAYMGTIDFSNTSADVQPRLSQPMPLPSTLASTIAMSTPAVFPVADASSMLPFDMAPSNQHYQWAASAAYSYPNAMSPGLMPSVMGDSQGNLYPATFPANDLLNDYRMQHDEPYFFDENPEEYGHDHGHGHGYGHGHGHGHGAH